MSSIVAMRLAGSLAAIILSISVVVCAQNIRFRRQAYPPNPAPFQARVEDYNLPPFYQPHPGRDASSLTPIFPFTSEFNNGLDVNPGTRFTVDGNLNVPILGWGIWDYKGGVKVGRANTRMGFGSLQRPTNVLGITSDTLATMAKDGYFNQARQSVPSIPVSVLPGNFVPLRCKPPFCNPFVHNTAFGVDVEPGDDYLFDGGLDFPIPLGPSGVGVRFPLSAQCQKYGNDEPLVVPIRGPLAQFPALVTADNFPLFPFTDQFSTGVEINPANKVSVAGDMNIPVPGWGNFDVDGNVYFGNINVDTKVGYQIRPTNKLNIKPETLALLGQNPAFREARRKAKEVVVGRIPYGYEPIKCKPPYCNPFVHHTGVAVEVEQGDDSFFIGGIDFPLPIGPFGSGVRFPLSGAVEAGTSPYAYAHGHAFNPVSPFDLQAINDDDVTQVGNRQPIRRSPTKKNFDKNKFYQKFFDKLPQ
ncbi:hypothetical protein RB195_007541 [Necator americanus]|uniref:Uncharacterized protein n=2 Tax=Necator americanus TaxID=51031 RepID=A0ABR1C0G2_NECAM|nr:hypothetical protein NECAME_01325 [Necator americanus]ETN86197.1 hypothetical protein NECAME_01325 [Necator americanus]